MSEQATIGVIICAYTETRWDLTLKAIESARAQTLPPTEVTVVVDHNPPLLERLRRHDPALRVIENSGQKGLADGRNTGIAASTAEFVAFLDDDAFADPEWLARMAAHMERIDVIAVGARVDPLWIGPRPRWLPDEFLWVVGCTYLGLPKVVQPVRNVMGGTMLVRRSVFNLVGGFSHSLGRSGGASLMSCEETELCVRATTKIAGSTILYEPNAFIRHCVSTDRLTWEYFLRRCFSEGKSKAVVAQLAGRNALSSEWRHTTTVLPAGVLRGWADAFVRGDFGGVARSAAIVVGFGAAALGFLLARTSSTKSETPPLAAASHL